MICPSKDRRLLRVMILFAASVSANAAIAATVRVDSVVELETAIRKAGMKRIDTVSGEAMTIELAAGVYELSAPLVLDARLSGTRANPTRIIARKGETVTLSGAHSLPALRWVQQKNGIWRARLIHPGFTRLWLGDRPLIRARYPDYDPTVLPLGGYAADATSSQRAARWHDPAGAVLHAIHGSRWGGLFVPILGKNADGSLRYGPSTGNNRDAPPSAKERFVDNVREELDVPDEWFFDAVKGWLYYIPRHGQRPPAGGFRAGVLEDLVHIGTPGSSAHDISIEGIHFRDTEPTFLKATEPLLRSDWKFHRGGAVLIENAERISLSNSMFTQLGGNAIVVSGHARQVLLRANHVHDVGASAIAFVGRPEAVRSPLFEYNQSLSIDAIDRTPGPKSDAYPADSLVQDNLIHDIGTIEKQAAGVQIAMAARITVDHNSIYRVPRAGINIGDGTWGGHVLSNNDVFDTVRETGDHGAFNSWGRDRYWHPDRAEMDRRLAADRGLAALDARETIVIRHNRFRCDHGWDIDLDDGSSNYLIEDNLLLVGGLKFREGLDRTARNNIIVNNSFHPHVWFADNRDIFQHNIVMTPYQPIRVDHWGTRVDNNLLPTQAALQQVQRNGTDTHSLAGDPQFVDPANGNYAVKATSPALKISFRNFRMDDFGVRPAWLKAIAAVPQFPQPILEPPPGQAEIPRSFAGMQVKSVETLGEQSAAGLPTKAGVMVLSVAPGSAADHAGLQPGDIILAVAQTEGAPREDTATAAQLVATAQGRRWQAQIPIEISRNQKRQIMSLDIR